MQTAQYSIHNIHVESFQWISKENYIPILFVLAKMIANLESKALLLNVLKNLKRLKNQPMMMMLKKLKSQSKMMILKMLKSQLITRMLKKLKSQSMVMILRMMKSQSMKMMLKRRQTMKRRQFLMSLQTMIQMFKMNLSTVMTTQIPNQKKPC